MPLPLAHILPNMYHLRRLRLARSVVRYHRGRFFYGSDGPLVLQADSRFLTGAARIVRNNACDHAIGYLDMALLENFFFGCGHCQGAEDCHLADAASRGSSSEFGQGRALVLAAFIVFIGPLASAIGGGYLAEALWGEGSKLPVSCQQAIGVVGGFVVGVVLAKMGVVVVRRFFCTVGGTQ